MWRASFRKITAIFFVILFAYTAVFPFPGYADEPIWNDIQLLEMGKPLEFQDIQRIARILNSEKGNVIWNKMSKSAKERFLKYVMPVRVVSITEIPVKSNHKLSKDRVSVSGFCKRDLYGLRAVNVFGWELWTYFQQVEWCSNDLVITWTHRRRWARVRMEGWKFVGHIGNDESGGIGHDQYVAFTQGHFHYCIPGVNGCFWDKFPWIEHRVFAAGGVWVEGDW